MRDPVLNALRSKLVAYESAGLDDLVKRVKARIAELEKAEKKAEAPAKPVAAKATVKKAAKKAAKKK